MEQMKRGKKMANYTIELRQIVSDPQYQLFKDDYPFYSDDEQVKKRFEEMFINYFFFNEIGCETVYRWKHMLYSRLRLKMPYYRQLYESELRSQDIDFMLNKDLIESYTKTIEDESQSESSTQSNGNTQNHSTNHAKLSNINDGVAAAELTTGKLTSVGEDVNNTKLSQNSSGNATSMSKGRVTEKNTFTSQGNIGVTSSAELLEKWRKVMININEIIINDCRDLFMIIY
jgi:hypothetical protein